MIETKCIHCGQRFQPGTDHVCQKSKSATKSAGGAESRRTSHIKGTGTPPDGMGPLGKDRRRIHKSGKTRPEPPKTDADKIAVASASLGPTDSSRAGVAASPVDKPKLGRPRLHADRRAYKAFKAKEYRAKKKAKPK